MLEKCICPQTPFSGKAREQDTKVENKINPHRYSESVDILYSTNIFAFDSPRTFNSFASSILPQNRNVIRRLHIDYHIDIEATYTLGAGIWRRSCDTIAGMPTLEELYIWLIKDDALVSASDSNITDPIRVIKGVRDFKVELVWAAEYDWDVYCLR